MRSLSNTFPSLVWLPCQKEEPKARWEWISDRARTESLLKKTIQIVREIDIFLFGNSLPVHAEPARLLVLADRPAHVVVGKVRYVVARLVDQNLKKSRHFP